MELVFIHGWGFDVRFWDALGELLPQYKQHRIDLGFITPRHHEPSSKQGSDGDADWVPDKSGQPWTDRIFRDDVDYVLIGHSLGFVYGVKRKRNWQSWIAINSFPRFVRTDLQPGCVAGAELRELRAGLVSNSTRALEAFYERIESYPPNGSPNIEQLRSGLDELRDSDAGNILEGLETRGLVLASRNDPLVPPKVSENLCGLVRNGVLLWNEGGGHTLPMRDPVWCAQAIEDFLA
jgi:pimeloyl-[acyl-carrier protein] methyl ester esterase